MVTVAGRLALHCAPGDHRRLRAPTVTPGRGVVACVFRAGPLSGHPGADHRSTGIRLLIGVARWAATHPAKLFVPGLDPS